MWGLVNGNGNGWKSVRWGVASAVILGLLGAGITSWRQFTIFEERQEYLMRLNEQQNQLFDVMKDSIRDLQKQIAMNAQIDDGQRERLKEHEDYIRHILERIRTLEKGTHE